jgi:hypothetical protein
VSCIGSEEPHDVVCCDCFDCENVRRAEASHDHCGVTSDASESTHIPTTTETGDTMDTRTLDDVIIELLAKPRYAGDDVNALPIAFGRHSSKVDPDGALRAFVVAWACGLWMNPCDENRLCGRELLFSGLEPGPAQREFLLHSVARWLMRRAGCETEGAVARASQVLFDLYPAQGDGRLPRNLSPKAKELVRKAKRVGRRRAARAKAASVSGASDAAN